MDAGLSSAFFGLAGSVVGGLTSYLTTALNQRQAEREKRLELHAQSLTNMYSQFVLQASEQYAKAWQSQVVTPSDLVLLYALVNQMRIFSRPATVDAAHRVITEITQTYSGPNVTVGELWDTSDRMSGNALAHFALAAREEVDQFNAKG